MYFGIGFAIDVMLALAWFMFDARHVLWSGIMSVATTLVFVYTNISLYAGQNDANNIAYAIGGGLGTSAIVYYHKKKDQKKK